MDNVVCYCLKCKSEIGRFRNAWNGIGNTYFSPVHKLISEAGLETTGDIYEAARGSSIQYSFLRDVVCAKCKMVIGLRCDSAPKSHILKQGQLILRHKDMSIISQGSGKVAHVSVLKKIPLKSEKRINTATPRSTSSIQLSSRVSTPSFLSSTHKFDDSGEKRVEQPKTQELSREKIPGLEAPYDTVTLATHVENFKSWAEEMISSQQRDINRISGAVFRVESDMKVLLDLIQEINGNLSSSSRHLTHEKKSAESKKDLQRMVEKLEQREESPELDKPANILAWNLKSISGNVKYLNTQAEAINRLSSSLETLISRVHKLEAQEKASVGIKCPARTDMASDKLPSLKRNRDPVEKHIYSEKQVKLSQPHLKKSCIDRPHDAESLNMNLHNAKSNLVSFSSMEPISQILDLHQSSISSQSDINQQKSSHRKPQVLIYGSNFKASVPKLKEVPGSFYPKANDNIVSGRQQTAEKSNATKNEDRNRFETAPQSIAQESDRATSYCDPQNVNILHLKSDSNLDYRHRNSEERMPVREQTNASFFEKTHSSLITEYPTSGKTIHPLADSKDPVVKERNPISEYRSSLSL